MENIRTGDVIFSRINNFSNYLILLLSGSRTNHTSIAVWNSKEGVKNQKLDIIPRYQDGAQLCFLEISKNKNLNSMSGKIENGVIATNSDFSKTRNDNLRYRPVNRKISDSDIVKKLKFFIEENKNDKYSIGILQSINIVTNLGKINHSSLYKDETCVSFVLKWLNTLGYEYSGPGIPVRSRQLYRPDNLLQSENSSLVFDGKEEIFYSKNSFLNELLFFFEILAILVGIFILFGIILYYFLNKKTQVLIS